MALDQSALLDLLESLKAADADDVIRHALQAVLQALIEAEATAVIGAAPHASATISPWLRVWEAQTCAVADRHLAKAVAHWEYDLLGDLPPWESWENEDETRIELTAWLIRHAPARLRARDAPGELLHRIRLLGLAGPTRWDDPHWPGHRY
ncbi:hypothetical protein GCM10009530_02560 [Microbispora corallina]|uniref:Uncharacterized protein n=1 Tax=Microbispora corallina TaxID=83302 RepID=A0ABQ4FRY4_9ACTN|nr:hypothetical protein Mco01_05170 [Microbispora corallina]